MSNEQYKISAEMLYSLAFKEQVEKIVSSA